MIHAAGTFVRRFLRSRVYAAAPRFAARIRSVRHRRYFRRRFSSFQKTVASSLFPNGAPVVVQTGPFRSLRYLDEIVWGSITPKWLGSYEAELAPILDRIVRRNYRTIADVGCAEGYYAVGLAVALPSARVAAFDTDFISRRQLKRLADLNGAEARIDIRGFCRHAELNALAGFSSLVICDIEGAEIDLLEPAVVPRLRQSDVLVEVHETLPNSIRVEETLCARFSASHRIERFVAGDRREWIEKNASNLTLPRKLLRQATDEHRATGRVWLWMESMEEEARDAEMVG